MSRLWQKILAVVLACALVGGAYLYIRRAPTPLIGLAPRLAMRYVTPNDPVVKHTLNDALATRPLFRNDVEAIESWVSSLRYIDDREAHYMPEYWQYPSETIRLGHGDCEDLALLLCSLLRAHGVPPEQVYVAVGGGHAFVILFRSLPIGNEWVPTYIEPQASGWIVQDIVNILLLPLDYQVDLLFNDAYSWSGADMGQIAERLSAREAA